MFQNDVTAKAKIKVQQSNTHNESNIFCIFEQQQKFLKYIMRKHTYIKMNKKQFKNSMLYSAALSYTDIIQNKNPEVTQNSESW